MNNNIREFISDVCKILKIKAPTVKYGSDFLTDTTFASYDLQSNTITIKHISEQLPELYFSIAHELRHAWQKLEDPEWFFSNYKDRTELDNDSYNRQFAEIDANAFAQIVMVDLFHIKPQWNNLPYEIILEIERRVNQIAISYNKGE